MDRLGLEALVDDTVRLGARVGGARPGRKVLTLVAAMLAGASHIDHADRLRSGSTDRVLGFRVMAPSTLGTFCVRSPGGMFVSWTKPPLRRCVGRGRPAWAQGRNR